MHNAALASYVWVSNRYRELLRAGNERALTTTEVAILTFVLVTAAAAVGAILYNYSTGQTSKLPEDPTAEIGG